VTWLIWNLVLVRLEMLLELLQDSCMVCAECTIGTDIVLDAPNGTIKLISVHLEIVLILIQDQCTVCAERTIGSEIILDSPDGTPR
jgi:hypothetical protein